MKNNLIVAHGGGPTAVINASLAGVLTEAKKTKEINRVFVSRHGIEGLMIEDFIDCTELPINEVEDLKNTPGSAPGSCRYKVTDRDYSKIIGILEKNNTKYFLYIGGNDSMDTCYKISKIAEDINVIGIPKTIDNDLKGTDHCPGFGSAAKYVAITTLELGIDVYSLPIHVVVIEIMGRNTGWLVAATSLARQQGFNAPHLIYFPERAFDKKKFLKDVRTMQKKFGPGIVVAVSEGIKGENGKSIASSEIIDGFGHKIPGGAALELSNILLKAGIKSRSEKPGLIGRVSKFLTSEVDRDEAFSTGEKGVQVAIQGKSGYMIGLKRISNDPYNIDFELVNLENSANYEKKLPDNYINKAGNDVTEECINYCKPLIGKNFPNYYKFRNKQ
jgi:ATP-dependent phosphofructokinase / diphosphate-dependent phosphofructokinase